MKSFFFLGTILILTLRLTMPLAAQTQAAPAAPQLPKDILTAICQSEPLPSHAASLALTQKLSVWMTKELRMNQPATVLHYLTSVMPVVTNEASMSLQERLGMPYHVGATNCLASVLWWRQNENELLAFRFAVATKYQSTQYFQSGVPQIWARRGHEKFVYDLTGWQPLELAPSIFNWHGLLPGSNGKLPDVLLSAVPAGSGYNVYLAQLHFDENGQGHLVWQYQSGGVRNIVFNPATDFLDVYYAPERFSKTLERSTFHLKWKSGAQEQ